MIESDLSKLLEPHKSELRGLAQHLVAGDSPKFVAGLSTLVSSLATGNPAILAFTPFAERVVAGAFASAADRRLLQEVESMESEEQQQAFVGTISESIEALLGQAVLQIVRVQHHIKGELVELLGGLRTDLSSFREDFQRSIEGAQVRLDTQRVLSGAVGIRVSARARQRIFVREQTVSGRGSTGVVLE